MSFLKKKRNDFLDKVSGQQAVAPSLEFKAKEVLNQYSGAPKCPFNIAAISSK
jgi:hypothetical protein